MDENKLSNYTEILGFHKLWKRFSKQHRVMSKGKKKKQVAPLLGFVYYISKSFKFESSSCKITKGGFIHSLCYNMMPLRRKLNGSIGKCQACREKTIHCTREQAMSKKFLSQMTEAIQ